MKSVGFVVLCLTVLAESAHATGKARPTPQPTPMPTPPPIKRAVQIDLIDDRIIELPDPDEPIRVYGKNIYYRILRSLYESGRYVVLTSPDLQTAREMIGLGLQAPPPTSATELPPDPCFVSAPPLASAKVSAQLSQLDFATGSRALHQYSGFSSEFSNAYNDGRSRKPRNEFAPIKMPDGRYLFSHFGHTFEDSGGLYEGIELGNELNFDIIWAGASIKHAEYESLMRLNVQLERTLVGENLPEIKRFDLQASGHGYFFDVSAHLWTQYGQFSGGIFVAQRQALQVAYENAIRSLTAALVVKLKDVPLRAYLGGRCGSDWYIAVGADYQISPGQRFYNHSHLATGRSPTEFVVEQVYPRTARVRLIGSESVAVGDEIISLKSDEPVPQPKPTSGGQTIALGLLDASSAVRESIRSEADVNTLGGMLESIFMRILKAIKDLITLPYRIWRFFQYDQAYKGGEIVADLSKAEVLKIGDRHWELRSIDWQKYLNTCTAGDACLGSRNTIVATVDSGVDYNHRELRRNIYFDGVRNAPGWDFFSNDPRPYDDHARGTEIVSLVGGGRYDRVGVAPRTTILPVKAFSPFGQTSSAALFESFKYAITNGARVILAAWATPIASEALDSALALAREKNVLVVVAAGDDGANLDSEFRYPAHFAAKYGEHVLVATAYDGSSAVLEGANLGRDVEIAAPGANIWVARPRDAMVRSKGHTGLAAGLVAGAAALAQARCPQWGGAELKKALLALRVDLPQLQGLSLERLEFYAQTNCK